MLLGKSRRANLGAALCQQDNPACVALLHVKMTGADMSLLTKKEYLQFELDPEDVFLAHNSSVLSLPGLRNHPWDRLCQNLWY